VMIRRPTYIRNPTAADYVMRFTGLTWRIGRTTDGESVFIVSTGHPGRMAALCVVESLTKRDRSDGWEPDGPDLFRRVTHFRP